MIGQEFLDCTDYLDGEQVRLTEDIAFFREMARRMEGPVLDLGCGTGRLAIPLAAAGMDVTALDISRNVLRRFRKKLEFEPPEIRDRIRLITADMSRFAFKKSFRCAICSSNTLLLLDSEKSIAEALACVASHLTRGGGIVIDVDAIDRGTKEALMHYHGENIPDLVFAGPGSRRLLRTHSITSENVATRFFETCSAGAHGAEPESDGEKSGLRAASESRVVSVRYEYFDSEGRRCSERRENLILMTPDELLRIIEEQGFRIIEKYGWYDLREFSEAERKLLVVAERE